MRWKRDLLVAVLTLGVAGLVLLGPGDLRNLGAVTQHPAWLFRAITIGRDTLIALDARDAPLSENFAPRASAEGARLFEGNCRRCHGAPGVAAEGFALAMLPEPPPLVSSARTRPPEEILWFIRNGLKMSGMPAWQGRLTEAEMEEVTAFVEALPTLSPADYRKLAARPASVQRTGEPVQAGRGAPEEGKRLMRLYGCRRCHEIPGLVGASVRVGPPLAEAGARRYIGGVLPNTPENMVRWLMDPQAVDPLSAMPDLGLDAEQAAHIAAYLHELAPPPPLRRSTPAGEDRAGRG